MTFYTFQRVKIVRIIKPEYIELVFGPQIMPHHLVGKETHILPGRAICGVRGVLRYQVAADSGHWAFAADEMEPILPEGLESPSDAREVEQV